MESTRNTNSDPAFPVRTSLNWKIRGLGQTIKGEVQILHMPSYETHSRQEHV